MNKPDHTLTVATGDITEMGNWDAHGLPAAYRLVTETFDLIEGEPIAYKVTWHRTMDLALRAAWNAGAILNSKTQTAIFNIVFRTGRYERSGEFS